MIYPHSNKKILKPQPFVKWAGGKTRIAPILARLMPDWLWEGEDICYIEPFVGGGGVLFHLISSPSITRVVINDINKDLIHVYNLIRNKSKDFLRCLETFNKEYFALPTSEERKEYYLNIRERYNQRDDSENWLGAAFFFLNHTCFNGLYRENSDGCFNVPFGNYANPLIYSPSLIEMDSLYLKKVIATCGDFEDLVMPIKAEKVFVYLDPPYRPLTQTSNFNTYNRSGFGDDEQVRLKRFCDYLTQKGIYWMMSNSYSKDVDGTSFFEELYKGSRFEIISAPRYINAHVKEVREKEKELVIMNYDQNFNLLTP